MVTFSDFYNQQRALGSQNPASSAGTPKYDFSWLPAPGKTVENPNPDSPLNTVIDIISRPLFGATTAVSGVAEGIARDQENGTAGLNTIGGILAAPTNFLAGLFSNDTSEEAGQKLTYGDLMERYTDRFGKINDPDYVDRENNVDPAFRGIVGFGADVLLDPLTWIPGGLFVKGAKAGAGMVGRGVKSAAKGIDAGAQALKASRAAKAGEQVAEEAAPVVSRTPVAETAVKVEDEALSPSDFIVNPPKVPDVDEAIVKVPDHLDWARAQRGSKKLESLLSKLDKTDDVAKRAKIDDEILKAYTTQVKKDLPGTAVKAAEPEGFERFASEFRASPNMEALRATLDSVQQLVGTTQDITRAGAKAVDNGQAIPASTMGAFARSAGVIPESVTDELSVGLQNALFDSKGTGAIGTHGRLMSLASKNSDVDDAIRQEARAALRSQYFAAQRADDITEQVKIADFAAALAYRKGTETARFNKILGPLAETLSKKSSERLDELVPKILEVLDPSASDDVLQRFFEGRNMKQLGESVRAALGVNAPYVKPVANTAEETAAVRTRLPEMSTAADEAVARTLQAEVTNAAQTYPHKAGNVRHSSLDEEVRLGRHTRQLNTFFQYSLVKNLRDAIYKRMTEIKGVGNVDELKGARRAQAYRQAFLEAGDSVSDSMLALGLKMHIGAGHQEKLLPLNVFEVYQLVERGFDSERMALAGLWNFGSAVAPTRLMEAVQTALTTTGKSADELLADVRTVLSNQKLTGKRGQVLDRNIPNNALSVKYGSAKGKSLVDPIAEAIVKALPDLQARLADNITNYAARGIDEASSLSNAEMNRLKSVIGTDDTAAATKAIAELRQSVAAAGEEIGAFPSSVQIATDLTEESLGATTVKNAKARNAADNKIQADEPRKAAVSKSSTDISRNIGEEADETLAFDEPLIDPNEKAPGRTLVEEDGVPGLDLGGMADVAAQQGTVSAFLNGFRRAFDQNYGMENVFGLFHAKRTVAGQYLSNVVDHLRPLKRFTPEQRVAAFKVLQSGVPNSSPELNAAVEAMQRVTDMIFDTRATGKAGFLNSRYLSVEDDISHINDIFKMKGLDEGYRFTDGDDVGSMLDQWRTWDMKDPMRDLYRLADAAATVAEHRSFVGNFVYRMKKEGLVSETYKPGMVRVTNSGGSTFARLMPEGLFVDKAMAHELHRLDILTRTSREFQGELGEFMRKTFIPVQNIWKQLVTVFRLGHHIRNAMGNFFMSWIDRGNRGLLQSYRDAFRVLGVKNNYSDIDLVDSLARIGDDRVPVGSEVLFSGRQGDWTLDEIAQAAQDRGLFSSYATSEDLMLESGMGRISELGSNISNSRVGRVAGNVSHFVDHHGKVQHLIQILRQEGGSAARWNYASKEKLLDRAVKEVKRSHPDSLMLTPTEAKLRFAIPFYTWFAKTLPFAMESMLRNPGRLAVLPKASYNLAVATGVNPESLIEPFPEDQLFPSFLTEGAFGPQFVGPDGQYIRINPGAPQIDMLESIGPNPIQGILGMTSPLFRVPAEMAAGSTWGNQAKINDMSDYLDQNLPIVNYLANMTGTSITGSAASLLQGQGLDPQYQVARGNKTGFDQGLSVVNWLSGLNAQNLSRPNYVNYAEIEKRNRENPSERSGF